MLPGVSDACGRRLALASGQAHDEDNTHAEDVGQGLDGSGLVAGSGASGKRGELSLSRDHHGIHLSDNGRHGKDGRIFGSEEP